MQSAPQCARTHATTSATLSHFSLATKLVPFSVSSRLYMAVIAIELQVLVRTSKCSCPAPHTRHVKR